MPRRTRPTSIVHQLLVTDDPPASLVRATGELDAYAEPELAALLERAFGTPVVFDLTSVSFLDSTALGTIARVVRVLGERGHRVAVVLPQTPARRIFEMTTLDRALPVYKSVAEALASAP